jgi:hypothetical protein
MASFMDNLMREETLKIENEIVICPHCAAQNPEIRRYNPATYTTLRHDDTTYQEDEDDTEDNENVGYVCAECGGMLIVDEKAINLQYRDASLLLIRLIEPSDLEELGDYIIRNYNLVDFESVVDETRKVKDYDSGTLESLLTKKGIWFVACQRESIEF